MLEHLRQVHEGTEFTAADWRAAANLAFGPFLRRKNTVDRYLEVFVTEFPNLIALTNHPAYLEVFGRAVKGFRVALRKDRVGTIEVLNRYLKQNAETDAAYVSMYHNIEEPHEGTSARNEVAVSFVLLNSLLEGCFKPRFVTLFALAKLVVDGTLPQHPEKQNFGKLVGDFPTALVGDFSLFLKDPVLGIPVNQWRNIAAHKDFRLISPTEVEVEYGVSSPRQRAVLTLEQLYAIRFWAFVSYMALRLAEVLVFFEYRDEVVTLGVPKMNLGLESLLVGITHSAHIAGYSALKVVEEKGEFGLFLESKGPNGHFKGSVYLMQVLAPLAQAIHWDVSRAGVFEKVSATLVEGGAEIARASVLVSDAVEYLEEQIAFEAFTDRIKSEFFEGFIMDKEPLKDKEGEPRSP